MDSVVERVFSMFDKNGDGRITDFELRNSLENLSIRISDIELKDMISKFDKDGDGCVDIDEFKELYRNIMKEEEEEEDMKEAFKVFDTNNDGFITVEELSKVLSCLGMKQGRSLDECKKMIERVDGDGDGRVDFKEFKKMMTTIKS